MPVDTVRYFLPPDSSMVVPHPFDILGPVPSLSCTRDEVRKARRLANLTLTQNNGRYCYLCDRVKRGYTASMVNYHDNQLIEIIQLDGSMFHLFSWWQYTRNWNPQTAEAWNRATPG